MTMVAGNISMSSPASTTSASSTTSAGNTAAAGTGGFTATLNQVMGQSTSADAETGGNAGNLLTMMAIPQETEAGAEGAEALLELLPALLDGLKELDTEIEADPELLAVLQNWIQQVQQLLSDASSNNGADQEASATITLLAQEPATIRFAVQDALTQLVALTGEQQNPEAATKAAQLLQSLQTLTKNTDIFPKELWSSVAKAVEQLEPDVPKVIVKQEVNQALSQTKSTHATVEASSQGQSSTNLNQGNAQTKPAVPVVQTQATINVVNAGEHELTVDAAPEATLADGKTAPVTTTAGQLVVQNHGTTATGPAASTVHVRQFASEMTEFVVQKLDIVKQLGITEAKISLRPDHLGQLDIKLSMQNGQLVAQFVTERIGAKDLLEQQMSQLRANLQSQGIQVSKVEVTHNESASSYMYQDGKGSGSQQQQSGRRSKQRTEEESDDAVKMSEMVEELRNWNEEQRVEREGNTTSFTARA
ncbi:Flagellar hook-length control protein FliK [compost metagenome]